MDPTAFLARARSLVGALNPAQRVSLAAAFVTVAVLVGGSSYWLSRPDYTLLFADLDPEGAADVVTRLKNEKVPYQLDPGGRAVRVASSRVDELRLEFASQGLPSSGRIGFEIFDRTAFGATEFLEQINYRRALEGEIGRTIGTIGEVAGARVHIAMARASLFESRDQPAKASVVLKLKSNRPLSEATVTGIRNLVASSVEGLRPDAVVILDTFGRPLARPRGDDNEPLGTAQVERQQQIEKDLATKVVALLEPVVGAERVRVNVSARLEAATEEETEEKWDPTTAVVRSRQSAGDAGGGLPIVQGAAGARANQPPSVTGDKSQPAAPVPAPPVSVSAAKGPETTNYEIGKTIRHTVTPRGSLARLSVAVILDDESVVTPAANGKPPARTTKPRTPAELQKIQALVAAAVGIDHDRGDQLTVENISFEDQLSEPMPTPSTWEKMGPYALDALRIIGGIVALSLAFAFFVRPLMRSVGKTTVATLARPAVAVTGGAAAPPSELDIEKEIDALAAPRTLEQRKVPVLTKRLGGLTQKEPEHAARLLRMWINEDAH